MLPFALPLSTELKPVRAPGSVLSFAPARQTPLHAAGHALPTTVPDVGGSPNSTVIAPCRPAGQTGAAA